MKFIEKHSQVAITIAALVMLLGLFSATRLNNSLLPQIERPEIALMTAWAGKTATEIEQTLIAPMEQQLSRLSFLKEINTTIFNGGARTVMTFHNNADMKQVYIDVLASINQVPNWPSQVSPPSITNYSNGGGATLASFFLYGKDEATSQELIDAYKYYVEPAFSKIQGVSAINILGTPIEQRVDIEFNPQALVRQSLTLEQVYAQLSNLVDRSGGTLTLGSKEYGLHFKGQMSMSDINNIAISARGQHIIRLSDLAEIKVREVTDWNFFALEGHRSLYFYLQPAKDLSVLSTIANIKTVLADLNQGPLKGLGLEVAISRDDSIDIRNALGLVYGSLILGVFLACSILYYFLRDIKSVGIVFISIPFCLALVFILMLFFGFSINVISLAGMALSIGLILDAAIVVSENIQQHRNSGASLHNSIIDGVDEVKGALFSSTLSSVIIFIPILAMNSTEGQLFEDLAFTISGSLLGSLVFSLLVLPALARYVLSSKSSLAQGSVEDSKVAINRIIFPATKRTWAIGTVFLGIPVALTLSLALMLPVDVLPDPKQNMVSTFINFDEPMHVDAVKADISSKILARLKSELASDPELPIITHGIMCFPVMCQLYFYTEEDWDYASFKGWVESRIVNDLVGTRIYTMQNGVLRFAMPDSRVTQLDLKGDDLQGLQQAGNRLLTHLQSAFPEASILSATPLVNRGTRIVFEPNQDSLAYLNVTREQLNRHLLALTDGLFLGNFYTGSNTLPFYLKSEAPEHLDKLLDTEIILPNNLVVPLRQLVKAELVLAPESIFRVDREVSVSLNLTPPTGLPMGLFIDEVKQSVKAFLASEDKTLFVSFRGSADNLKVFLDEFNIFFLTALLVLFLLMWLTLKSWRLATAVLLSMPLAILGGMLNLQLLNQFVPQNLDVITMIGFIILMGLVINNAILMTSQYHAALLKNKTQMDAIADAVLSRKRAIYMSTWTTILGTIPLMLNPASSSEIYRGLAAVISGGMMFSVLFTMSFMSALLSLPMFAREALEGRNPVKAQLQSEA